MTAIASYYLASGFISKATLLASSSNNLENFPVQSDQAIGIGWWTPSEEGTTRAQPARVVQAADGSTRFDGYYKWKWAFKFWTKGQYTYFMNTFFGGVDVYVNGSAQVTAQTFVENGYQAYQAQMGRPLIGSTAKNIEYDYQDVILEFTYGVLL